MPIDGAVVFKTPVDRDPARPPRFEANVFGTRGVTPNVEDIEILPGENIPVAVEKSATQMVWQRFERAAIRSVICVNRIVGDARANKIVVACIVKLRAIESGRRRVIDPQRFHPGVTDVAGVGRASHACAAATNRATIARREKLPLLQREVRQLVDADEKKLGALIRVDIVFVAAMAKARGRTVLPRYDVLRFVVLAIERARHITTKICE
jgi:hypothetical protein